MQIDHVLAVVAVSDIDTARRWYERFFDRPPDNTPMASLIEWRITANGWLQVSTDAANPGHSNVNFAVAEFPGAIGKLQGRGIEPGERYEANQGVEIASFTDPDGNTVTLIGNFREAY